MAGHRPFSELIAKMSPEAQREIRKGTAEILAEMELGELRQILQIRQVDLARKLKTTQAAISRLEKRPQMLVNTLGDYVEALGGKIEVRAVLPDRTVSLTNFFRDKAAPGDKTAQVHVKVRTKTGSTHATKVARRIGRKRDLVHA